jgi:hypothetical protein
MYPWAGFPVFPVRLLTVIFGQVPEAARYETRVPGGSTHIRQHPIRSDLIRSIHWQARSPADGDGDAVDVAVKLGQHLLVARRALRTTAATGVWKRMRSTLSA